MRNVLTALSISLLVMPAAALGAEGGFSNYGLGGSAFNAGVTPPAGLYVTSLASYYTGVIEGTATVGGVPVTAGADVGFFATGLNVLYVPDMPVLGGNLGLSVTPLVGCMNLTASLSAGGPGVSSTVNGCGLGDTNARVQVGWENGTVFWSPYVNAVLPTGLYSPTFSASIGLHRPAVDAGVGLTWIEPSSKIQLNLTPGVTYNFENTATQYTTGVEFHLDWAVGKDFGNGWTAGIVGYDYRQLTPDTGTGATLGPYMGSVDAVGVGADYATEINNVPASFSFRHYQEFNAVNRFQGASTLASLTFAY